MGLAMAVVTVVGRNVGSQNWWGHFRGWSWSSGWWWCLWDGKGVSPQRGA